MQTYLPWKQWGLSALVVAGLLAGCSMHIEPERAPAAGAPLLAATAPDAAAAVTADVSMRRNRLIQSAILVANENSAPPARTAFAPGYETATIEGVTQFPFLNHYLLRASSGHAMTVELSSESSDVYFAIHGVDDGYPYRQLGEPGNRWSAALPDTQDYLLTVANQGGKAAFAVDVSLQPSLTLGNLLPRRLQLESDTHRTAVSGSVTAQAQARYLLHGEAGQHLTVEIDSAARSAQFGLVGVEDQQTYKWVYDGASAWSGILPSTQDYLLILDSQAGTSDYDLVVTMYSVATAMGR